VTVWIILAITPFITLLFLEEVIQFFYQRYVYGASGIEKKLTSKIGTGRKKIHDVIHRTKARAEG
jgi:hypothetical protein